MPGSITDVKSIFGKALEIVSHTEREEFLAHACGDDPRQRAEVESLLQAGQNAGRFFADLCPPPTAGIDLSVSESPGDVIGSFKLLEEIGEGGFGVVFLAEQTQPVRRKVALKVLKPGMYTRQVVARFEAERQALAMMDHINITRVFDGGTTENGRPYFVMELVHGVPITKYCDDNHLTPRQRLELFVPVCQAIQHAHQKGIIHRDIKPSNVLVTFYEGKPVPKVIDFGVAKTTEQKLTEHTLFTQYGTMVGTLEYMSPEQAEMSAGGVDTRSDIYSLGVLLYELLTGSTPLTHKRMNKAAYAEILRMIKEEEPPKPSTRLSDSGESLALISAQRHMESAKLTKLVKGELDWIVMKSLEKDPSRRYETASAFAADIHRYLLDEPVLAYPPSTTYRLLKFTGRNKVPVFAAAIICLLLIGGIIGTTWGMVSADRAWHEQERRAKGERLARKAEAVERNRAEHEKRIAQSVRDFLQYKLLRQADANEQADTLLRLGGSLDAMRENPTIRELLDRAATELTPDKIDQHFPKQPMVQAEILETIAVTYRGVGEFEKSIALFVRAHDMRCEHLGPDHAMTLATHHQLAVAYHYAGRLIEATRLYEQVRDKWYATVGPDDTNTLATRNGVASAYRDAGRVIEAIEQFEQLRVKFAESHGPDHRSTLTTICNLAETRKDAGQFTEAIRLYEQVRDKWIATIGPAHPATLSVLNKLAAAYLSAGQLTEAIQLLEQVRDKQWDHLGQNHPDTLITLNNLALAYSQAGRQPEANRLYDLVRAKSISLLGPKHPDTLTALHNLASTYLSAGRTRKAIELFEHVRDTWIETRGPDHPGTLNALNGLAVAYGQSGKLTEAIALHEQVLDRRTRTLGPYHPATLTTLNNLASAYVSAGKATEAIDLLQQLRDKWNQTLGPNHPNSLATISNLARAYVAVGKLGLALSLHEQTLASRKVNLGPDHPDTLTSLNNLATAYWVAKNLDRSIPLFEELLERRRTTYGEDHPETLRAMTNLGINYRDGGRLKDALPILEEAHERYQRSAQPIPTSLLFVPEALAQTYERAGAHDKAEALYRQDLDATSKRFGANCPRTADAMARLGLYLFKQRKFAEAEPILGKCLAIRQGTVPHDAKTFNTQSLLGGCLLGQRKYDAAEPQLQAGYEGLKTLHAKSPNSALTARSTEALDRLVQLYRAWGKLEQTAQWQKQLQIHRKDLRRIENEMNR
jgi:serine/threonine protein kinase/Tfp pilus assembly protein PilF